MQTPDFCTCSGGWIIHNKESQAIIQQGRLDELLRGGLLLPPPKNSNDGLIVMIRGKAGTGKSTLMLQLAANIKAEGKPTPAIQFLSLEQNAEELQAIFCRLVTHQCLSAFDLRIHALQKPDKETFVNQVADEYISLLGVHKKNNLGMVKFFGKAFNRFSTAEKTPQNEQDLMLEDLRLKNLRLEDLKREEEFIEKISKLKGDKIDFHPKIDTEHKGLKDEPLSEAYRFVEEKNPDGDKRSKRPLLFIDGLSTLSGEDRIKLEMGALIYTMRKRCQIGFIGFEPSGTDEEYLDHQADIVIELEEKHLKEPIEYLLHELHIKKSRYQEAALGWHQYKIRNYGLEIYPSTHFQVHAYLNMSRQLNSSMKPVTKPKLKPKAQRTSPRFEASGHSILETILGGVVPGDSVALLGPRGAFKTKLTLDFLMRSEAFGCPIHKKFKKHPEHGLLVSIIDNEITLRENQHCPVEARGCNNKCFEHLFLFYQRPGCISTAEFLYYLKMRLELAEKFGAPIKRLAFWDLTQLEHRFPLLANDPMFLPAMLDLFKSPEKEKDRMIKSVFMGAANASLSDAISAMADNVVFCWRDRVIEENRPVALVGGILPEVADYKKLICKLETMHRQACFDGRLPAPKDIEYLLLYVDRTSGKIGDEKKAGYVDQTSGKIGDEKKALYAFPINNANLLFPYDKSGAWDLKTYEMERRFHSFFQHATEEINKVNGLQGLEKRGAF